MSYERTFGLRRAQEDRHGLAPMCPDPPAMARTQLSMGEMDAVESFYALSKTDADNYDRQDEQMGHGLFDTVEPQGGRNTGWTLTDARRPLPPALFKRPNSMLTIDHEKLIGPPAITGSPHGNQVWMREQVRRLAGTNAKVNSGRGALDHYSLFPGSIATGGGEGTGVPGLPDPKTVFGYTWTGYHSGPMRRWMPTHENKRREMYDGRTRNPEHAYAKPGGMFGQEQARLGILKLPRNSDVYEIPWRSMLPSKSAAAGLPALPENVVLQQQRGLTATGDGTHVALGPPGPGHMGERPIYRDQLHQRVDSKQVIDTGWLLNHGGRNTYGDLSLNDAENTRYTARQYTTFSSRPANPGYIGGMEFVADVQRGTRMVPSGRKKLTKRAQFSDYAYHRVKIPDATYAMQYNQQYGYFGDRRQVPQIEVSPDSAILEARRRNPFAVPLNPFEKTRELP